MDSVARFLLAVCSVSLCVRKAVLLSGVRGGEEEALQV